MVDARDCVGDGVGVLVNDTVLELDDPDQIGARCEPASQSLSRRAVVVVADEDDSHGIEFSRSSVRYAEGFADRVRVRDDSFEWGHCRTAGTQRA